MATKRPREEEDDFYLEPELDDNFGASDGEEGSAAEERKTGRANKKLKSSSSSDGKAGIPKPAGNNGAGADAAPALSKQAKRKQRLLKLKEKFRAKDREADGLILSGHDSHCNYWNAQYAQAFKDKITPMELEESTLQESHFVESVDVFEGERDLDKFAGYVKLAVPEWKKQFAAKQKGSDAALTGRPSLIIITTAGVRAVEIIRALGEFHTMCKIGKMFAKHFKPEEQMDYLKKNVVRIVVGTPNRLMKLVDDGALSMDGVHTVLIDCFRDVKQRNMFQYHELRTDLFALFNKHMRTRIISKSVKLTLY